MVGDIVWAPFPFTSLSNTKVRPVLIVADVRNLRENDWIVCEITSASIVPARAIEITQSDRDYPERYGVGPVAAK